MIDEFCVVDIEKDRAYWCDVKGCVEVYNFRK